MWSGDLELFVTEINYELEGASEGGDVALEDVLGGTSSAKDEVLIDAEDVALGHETRMRWNPHDAWIFSPDPVHPAIVERATFDQARALLAGSAHRAAHRKPRARHARTSCAG